MDFGDLQIFEGVTTYPAIVTLRRINGHTSNDNLRFLKTEGPPDDLSKVFAIGPIRCRARGWGPALGGLKATGWMQIRKKMAAGRRTLPRCTVRRFTASRRD